MSNLAAVASILLFLLFTMRLLPGTYTQLMNLRLSKAERSQTKTWLQLSERLAKTIEQLYLKTPRDNTKRPIVPLTIENISLPTVVNHESMKSSGEYIKKFALKNIIRFLQGQNCQGQNETLNRRPHHFSKGR